jgi:predicted regulator of Ras-like GTPase activity (Roadblock/LC7/MglB family)
MRRQEELQAIIVSLRTTLPTLKGVLIASIDGLAIAQSLAIGDPNRIAAMAATALGLGKRVIETIDAGGLSDLTIGGTNGQMFVYSAGASAVLVIIANEKPNVGLINLEAREAAKKIAALT